YRLMSAILAGFKKADSPGSIAARPAPPVPEAEGPVNNCACARGMPVIEMKRKTATTEHTQRVISLDMTSQIAGHGKCFASLVAITNADPCKTDRAFHAV